MLYSKYNRGDSQTVAVLTLIIPQFVDTKTSLPNQFFSFRDQFRKVIQANLLICVNYEPFAQLVLRKLSSCVHRI